MGGSCAKGLEDQFSDRDFCITYEKKNDYFLVSDELKKIFGSPSLVIDKKNSIAIHFEISGLKFEVRLLNIQTVKEAKEALLKNESLSFMDQELLENIRIGIFYKTSKEMKKIKADGIQYPCRLSHSIIMRYLPLLSISDFEVPVARGDSYFIMKHALDLKEVIMALANAQSRIFLSGFKHEEKLLDRLSPIVKIIWNELKELSYNHTDENLKSLSHNIEIFKADLLKSIGEA